MSSAALAILWLGDGDPEPTLASVADTDALVHAPWRARQPLRSALEQVPAPLVAFLRPGWLCLPGWRAQIEQAFADSEVQLAVGRAFPRLPAPAPEWLRQALHARIDVLEAYDLGLWSRRLPPQEPAPPPAHNFALRREALRGAAAVAFTALHARHGLHYAAGAVVARAYSAAELDDAALTAAWRRRGQELGAAALAAGASGRWTLGRRSLQRVLRARRHGWHRAGVAPDLEAVRRRLRYFEDCGRLDAARRA